MIFKVGDKVKCVKAGSIHGMEVGGIYTISRECSEGGDPNYVQLKEFLKDHPKHSQAIWRFVLWEDAPSAMLLPEDPKARKGLPITTGVLDYFPRALAAVAACSKAGNDQHNPGQPLHWDKSKSGDHADCIARHLIDRNSLDTDGIPHAVKLAWRALANLEIMIEEGKVKL